METYYKSMYDATYSRLRNTANAILSNILTPQLIGLLAVLLIIVLARLK
ncbi:MAG: hypothetical protein FD167_4282 [bacterium]|nr:MAG: hypothetical protein FD167_4282 [bacterium]